MTFQRKTNSFIQHRFGKLLFCSQSFEVSFDRITYSKTADTPYSWQHCHLRLFLSVFLLIPEGCCCGTVTIFYLQGVTAPPACDTSCPWQQTPTLHWHFPAAGSVWVFTLLRGASVLGTEARRVLSSALGRCWFKHINDVLEGAALRVHFQHWAQSWNLPAPERPSLQR